MKKLLLPILFFWLCGCGPLPPYVDPVKEMAKFQRGEQTVEQFNQRQDRRWAEYHKAKADYENSVTGKAANLAGIILMMAFSGYQGSVRVTGRTTTDRKGNSTSTYTIWSP